MKIPMAAHMILAANTHPHHQPHLSGFSPFSLKIVFGLACCGFMAGCVTWANVRAMVAPAEGTQAATRSSPQPITPKIISQAIDEGGESYAQLRRELDQLTAASTATLPQDIGHTLLSLIITNATTWGPHQLRRSLTLLRSYSSLYPWVVFTHVLRSPLAEAPGLAWHSLLEIEPTADHRSMVDRFLSNALSTGDINKHLTVEMAQVISKWQVTSVYDVAKLGLMKHGDVDFAQAMAALSPPQATLDFMNYLALVPDSDLRQLSMAAMDDLTANMILSHLQKFPPDLGHNHFDKLFVFAASRQTNLKTLALQIIDQIVPAEPAIMAYRLSRQPLWVQYALIEDIRRTRTGGRAILLTYLATVTSDPHIAQEIADLQLSEAPHRDDTAEPAAQESTGILHTD